MAQYTPEQVIAAYEKVLKELFALKSRRRPPEQLLPLPKAEMVLILQSSMRRNKEQLISLLSMFESGERGDLFFAHLILPPALLALAYTVAIAVQGATWWWVSVALAGAMGGFFAKGKSMVNWEKVPKKNVETTNIEKIRYRCLLLLIELGETVAVICWSAVWVRLVTISGLYGLYQSLLVPLWHGGINGFGDFAALLSLVFGYFLSRQLNAFFFFVTQFTRRRQFREQTRVEA